MPSDLLEAQQKAELVQKGFYDREPLELSHKYTGVPKHDPTRLRPLDPRLAANDHMLGNPNAAVQVNQELMEEVLYN